MAWVQIAFGLLLVIVGIVLPAAKPHDAHTMLRNIIIGITTAVVVCSPSVRTCATDKVRRSAIAMYIISLISYITWEIYNVKWLLIFYLISILMAVIIIMIDALVRIWKIKSRKKANNKIV